MRQIECKAICLCMTFVLFLCVLGIGCATKEEKEARHLERARQYIEKSEFRKAVIELKNVIQLDPQNDGAYYELGDTYVKLKEWKDAFQAFSRAVSINPDNMKAQLKLGQSFLLGKNTEEARKKAELILEKSPDNIDGLILLAGVQVLDKDTNSAIKTLKKASSINPNHFDTHLSLGRLFLMTGDLDQAEKTYLKAISLNRTSRVPYIELSRVYGIKGQWDKAESELKKMIEASGPKYQNLYILARYYESRGKLDQAEKIYLEAAGSAPEEDVAPLINLGSFYARRKSYDKALKALQEAAEIKKDDLNILASIAQLHFDFRKLKEAGDAVDEVLKKDNGHVRANILKGRLYLEKKDFANALERLDLAVRASPRNPIAHYFKALSLIGKGESNLAQQDLLKAVELDPRLLDARLILAEFYLRERNKSLAREQIETALRLAPRYVRTLMLQGNLKIMERDFKGAEAVFKQVTKEAPDYAPGYVSLGLLYNITRRQEDALKNFEKSLELNPRQYDALALMVGTYVRQGKYDEAIQICERLKGRTEENSKQLALIEYLEGNVSLARKDSEKAQRHYEKAISTDPNILGPYLALATIYVREDRLKEAVAQYETILQKNPKYLGGYMALGTIYDQQDDGERAEAYYRKALEIKNDFAPAANNLAWNLAENGKNIDEALGFAQIAKEKMPNNASVMDTLGWIYYLKGSYLNAVTELQDSLARDPDNPVINYHLGLAYFKNNQPDAAREVLERALEIEQSFKGSKEAQRVLNNIKDSQASN